MSKTTTMKITTRIITTYLPCLDTAVTIKSPLFCGETSVYFGEPRADEVPHRELGGRPVVELNRYVARTRYD